MADNTVYGDMANTAQTMVNVNPTGSNVINVNQLASLLSTVNALNGVVAQMYGTDVKYFRLLPVERAADVIFQEYTLHNVEACPLEFRAMYSDSNYDEAGLQYQLMGIEYVIPLTLEIAVSTWEEVTKNDLTIPQKGDIVYIMQSNKLYEVASMSPVKTVSSQITSYKLNLASYKPKFSVVPGQELVDTIDMYTTSVEKEFGEEIKNEIKDIVNDKELSPMNTTYDRDRYKEVARGRNGVIDCITAEEHMVNGHIIMSAYYTNSESYTRLVTYKNIDEQDPETRTFSCMFNMSNSGTKQAFRVGGIIESDGKTTTYKCTKFGTVSKYINVSKDIFSINGYYDAVNCTFTVDNAELEGLGAWERYSGLTASDTLVNLFRGDKDGEQVVGIMVSGKQSITVRVKDKTYKLALDEEITENNWYNLVVNLGKNGSAFLYDVENTIQLVFTAKFKIPAWNNIFVDDYYVPGSNGLITNIRLYDSPIDDADKQLFNIVELLGNNDSHLIIADNADELYPFSYFGEQR